MTSPNVDERLFGLPGSSSESPRSSHARGPAAEALFAARTEVSLVSEASKESATQFKRISNKETKQTPRDTYSFFMNLLSAAAAALARS